MKIRRLYIYTVAGLSALSAAELAEVKKRNPHVPECDYFPLIITGSDSMATSASTIDYSDGNRYFDGSSFQI